MIDNNFLDTSFNIKLDCVISVSSCVNEILFDMVLPSKTSLIVFF